MARDALRVAIAQMNAAPSIEANLRWIDDAAARASEQGAEALFLPENATQLAPAPQRIAEAEPLDGRQGRALAETARTHRIALVVGSIAEQGPDPDHTWATTLVYDAAGSLVGTYRKTHLFDVDVADDTSFRESDTIARGPWAPTVVDVAGWRVGLSICYDLRFPELYRALSAAGAEVLAVPAAFTYRTGAAHWHPLLRARAIENQCYVVAAAQVGRHYGTRESYGHALAVSPWGEVIATCEDGPGLTVTTLQRARLEDIRRRLPALSHRRNPGT